MVHFINMPQLSTASITDVSESHFYALHQEDKQMDAVDSGHCLVSNKFNHIFLNM